MRKLLALVLVLGLIVALSACTVPTGGSEKGTTLEQNPTTTTTAESGATSPTTAVTTAAPTEKVTTTSLPISKETIAVSISREQAIDIALNAAGLSRENVYDLEAELDREFGGTYWEVDFETREFEYSYDVDAQSGAVARTERERN